MRREPLPIDGVLPGLVESLRGVPCAVLRAPTGAGKTTRVPQALLDSGLADDGKVIVLEPRRLAARAAARRMSAERGTAPGDEVGWNVRFDRRSGPRTRILVVTEGVFLRMLQDDPFLDGVGAVVFDEFHERNLASDLALAMTRRTQLGPRADLRVVVMSATADAGPVSTYLGGCPVVESEGFLHPVDVRWLGSPDTRPVHESAADGVRRALAATEGDVLVFLPGVGEIRRTGEELADVVRRHDAVIVELFGDLPPERQDAALRRGPTRRVVLATNVAETSVTVEGVTAVVDSGLARVLRHDPASDLERLDLVQISRASAEQRRGRAGRTAPGVCFRLWTEREHRGLAEHLDPEVRRVDVAGAVLELLAWGESDVRAFPWFEAPDAARLARAELLLERLGATRDGVLTEVGRAMALCPVHPRLARLLVEGHRLGHPARAALAAAVLSERDPVLASSRPREARQVSESDVLDRVDALEAFERTGRRDSAVGELHGGGAEFVLRSRDQLARLIDGALGRAPAARGAADADKAVLRATFAAYPDRLARRREPGSPRAVLVGGGGVRVARERSVQEPELFVCVALDSVAGVSGDALCRLASGVRREWLPEERLRTDDELAFDPDTERVTAVRRTRWDDLVLEGRSMAAPTDHRTAEILAEAAAQRLDRALALEEPAVASFLARVRSLRGWMPDLGLPGFDDDELRALLPDLCTGRRSIDELRRAPLLDHLRGRLTATQLHALDRDAPERLMVPSGSRIALRYEPGRPPVLAARIQELFGLRETPRVAAGRVPVLLHLLAPSGRPQQVTDDLRSFWDNVYPQVRKELRRRYPRHAWPEDPWTAAPERRPRPRRPPE